MTSIAHIQSLVPRYKTTSEELIAWAEQFMENHDDYRKFRYLVQKSAIDSKYSVTGDFSNRTRNPFYTGPSPDTARRLESIKREATDLGFAAGKLCLEQAGLQPEDITHIIAVSCTGIFAPGLEIIWAQKLGLKDDITRFAINFMGCYAAMHAIKLGHLIGRDNPHARVLVIAAEICTLHMQQTGRIDDLLSTALFGDGAAAWIMQSNTSAAVEAVWLGGSTAVTGQSDLMAWAIDNHGFSMTLSQEVSSVIRAKAGEAINKMLSKIYTSNAVNTADKDAISLSRIDYYAIHPGGKNILDALASLLRLPEDAMRHSVAVLKHYGNMSSPSVMFVLKDIMRDFEQSRMREALVLCAAFGPGLTMETGLIKLRRK